MNPDEWLLLRHISSLVADDAEDAEVFAAVNQSLAHLAGADVSVLIRFEPNDTVGFVAVLGSVALDEQGIPWRPGVEIVRELQAIARPERWDEHGLARRLSCLAGLGPGTRSSLALPIRVGGRIWGLSVLVAAQPDAFAGGAMEPLIELVDLMRPTFAWAGARRSLRHLRLDRTELRRVADVAARAMADEQAALRRVA